MSNYNSVRRATEADLEAIMTILGGRRQWLRETKCSDQWSSVREWRHLLLYLLRRGHVWVLVSDASGQVLGTVTIGADPDRDFWTPSERRTPALYISKLATDVHAKGHELGNDLLAWGQRYAASQRIRVLRLDTWKTSQGLRDYYVQRGWKHVRTVDLERRDSGSLFERQIDSLQDWSTSIEDPTRRFPVNSLWNAT
jgi:ribosomal protein S18 acetylase RimI-like enzyme